MAKRRKRGGAAQKRLRRASLLAALLLFCVFAANAALLVVEFRTERYSLTLGERLDADVTAQAGIGDPYATDRLRQRARDAVQTVYVVDESVLVEQEAALDAWCAQLDAFLVEMGVVWEMNAEDAYGDGTYFNNTKPWTDMLSDEVMEQKLAAYALSPSAGVRMMFSALDEWMPPGLRQKGELPDLTALKTAMRDALAAALADGVYADAPDAGTERAAASLKRTTLSITMKELAASVTGSLVTGNMVEDTQATTALRDAAADAVETQRVARGDVLYQAGETVTNGMLAHLSALNMLASTGSPAVEAAGYTLYVLLVYALLFVYLRVYRTELIRAPKTMLSISLILLVNTGMTFLMCRAEPRLSPVLFAPLLIASLHDRRAAMAVNVQTALTVAVMIGARSGNLFDVEQLGWVAASMATGQAAIAVHTLDTKRGGMIVAGLVGGACGGLVIVSRGILTGLTFLETLLNFSLYFAGAVIATVLAIGVAAAWELLFDLPTDARLNELLNANHPLLKRMMSAAPGTYHHCMMSAQLSESGAEAIGAQALLARVAATYHDVGKLKKPLMFKENQGSMANPHDDMPPLESVAVLSAHQQDAEPILQRYRMPLAVRRIAAEHHGNTLMAYFFHKAQQQTGKKLPEKPFRYDAPRPTTRESAIVMLADSCEAAVRSLSNPTEEEIARMVHSVVKGKIEDNQFVNCPITMQELARVETAFLNTFTGIMHDRITYPDEEDEI